MKFPQKIAFACFLIVPMWLKAQEPSISRDSISKIRTLVAKEEIAPNTSDKSTLPDWKRIEQSAKRKYGLIGEEKVYGAQMIYYFEKKEWCNFGKYYSLYYKTAFNRSEYHINNMTWAVFEHVTDLNVLLVAIETIKYSLLYYDQQNANAHDTYANLLHKVGRTSEAIIWEKKALQMDPASLWKKQSLNKMENGVPTWN